MINNTVVLLIHIGHCFTMPDYYIKISRRIDQFGSCVLLLKNFKVDLDQLSLLRKFDFDIIPYRKI